MRGFVALVFCLLLPVFTSASAQGSNWGGEESEAQLDKQVYANNVAMTAAKIEWLRNGFIAKKLSEVNLSKRNDCSLALSLLAAYASANKPSDDEMLAVEKVLNSSLIYKSIEGGSSMKSNFAKKVFKSTDYFNYGEELFEIAGGCEELIEPYYREFEAASNVAGSLK